jgi:hypothetical protein
VISGSWLSGFGAALFNVGGFVQDVGGQGAGSRDGLGFNTPHPTLAVEADRLLY